MVGQWHAKWQNLFSKTEIKIENRRADAIVGPNAEIVLEFQHSWISEHDVSARNSDYKNFGKKIVWIVDGTELQILNDPYRSYKILDTRNKKWLVENFKDCRSIFIDISEKIYSVDPKMMQSLFIPVNEPLELKDFVSKIETGEIPWNPVSIESMGRMFYNQRGPGSGKTYESMSMVEHALITEHDERFSWKKRFIFTTKTNSAVWVIRDELRKQYNTDKFISVVVDEENRVLNEIEFEKVNKSVDNKVIIDFEEVNIGDEASRRKVNITIGTIDSLFYAIAKTEERGRHMFVEIAKNIARWENLRFDKKHSVYYGDIQIPFDVETVLIVDEAQDLDPEYADALASLVKHTGIDVWVIGDKLQSIYMENNIFTKLSCIDELDGVKIIKDKNTNQTRRFKSQKMADFINKVIPYERYDLPKLSVTEPEHTKETVHFFTFGIECKEESFRQIIDIFEKESSTGRIPEDFMLISPYVNNQPTLVELNSKINEFWIRKKRDVSYVKKIEENKRYTGWLEGKYFSEHHASEEGKPIDLSTSEEMTRIQSIHSAKGNGRPVVILINLNDKKLRRFSEERNLQYYSLLNVALTRSKDVMYIGIPTYRDFVRELFEHTETIDLSLPPIDILKAFSTQFSINDVIEYVLNTPEIRQEYKKYMNTKIIRKNGPKALVDFKHHVSKSCCLKLLIMHDLAQDHYRKKIKKIKNLGIAFCEPDIYYKKVSEFTNPKKHTDEFPILTYDDPKWQEDRSVITDLHKKSLNILVDGIKELTDKHFVFLCHMLDTYTQGNRSKITIDHVYDLVDKKGQVPEFYKHVDNPFFSIISDYLQERYPNTRKHENGYNFEINWPIKIQPIDETLQISSRFSLFGYSDKRDSLVNVVFASQFNELNMEQIWLESIFSECIFAFSSAEKTGRSFAKNNIETVIITYESSQPIHIQSLLKNTKFMELFRNTICSFLDSEFGKMKKPIIDWFIANPNTDERLKKICEIPKYKNYRIFLEKFDTQVGDFESREELEKCYEKHKKNTIRKFINCLEWNKQTL